MPTRSAVTLPGRERSGSHTTQRRRQDGAVSGARGGEHRLPHLQGFPADWTRPAEAVARSSHRWKLVGNAVTVDMASAYVRFYDEVLRETSDPFGRGGVETAAGPIATSSTGAMKR